MTGPMLSLSKMENGYLLRNRAISNGAVPHNSNLEASNSTQNTNKEKKVISDNLSSKNSKLAYFGAGLGVTIVTTILVLSSLSPGTMSA